MTVLTALVALGLVEIAAFTGLVSVSPAVIAMVTRVSVAAIGGPGVAVRVIVARAILLLYVGRLLRFTRLVRLVLTFDKPYEALTINMFVWISVRLIDTPLDVGLSEMVPGSQECSGDHAFEQRVGLQGSGIRVNVNLMPSALELRQMVENVGVL